MPTVFDNIKHPNILVKTTSDISGDIEVSELDGHKTLKVNGVNQSIDPDDPSVEHRVWGGVVNVIKQQEPELRNILIMGLGGGTMQHLISREFPGVEITSIEIDPVIVDVATNYFGVADIPNHKIITADACRLIVEPDKYELGTQIFQVVVVDIFIGANYPDLGGSGNFISRAANMAIINGLVIFNRNYTDEYQEETDLFKETLEDFLHDVDTYTVAGRMNAQNLLIFGRT